MSDELTTNREATGIPYRVGPGKPPLEYRFKPGNHQGGRPRLPLALKKHLPEAVGELIALCSDPDPQIRLKAVQEVLRWNLGQPGGQAIEEPEDLRSLFNEALVQFGWKVVKMEPTEGEVKCAEESQP